MTILRTLTKTPKPAVFVAAAMSVPALLGLALPGSAHADLVVCNNTPHAVRVAVGYSTVKGLTSGGWWDLKPNGCKRMVGDDEVADRTRYWVYAEEIGGGHTWEGDMDMCTTKVRSPFTVRRAGCADRGFVVHNFYELVAPSGSMTTHLRLNGGRGNMDDNQ